MNKIEIKHVLLPFQHNKAQHNTAQYRNNTSLGVSELASQ